MSALQSRPTPDLSTSPRAVWRLTWPQMLMMYLVFFMGLVAVWVAGQISAEVQAALGMVNQCGILLMVVAMAISSGATAAVSQSLGALKVARAQRYVGTTVLGCFALGFVVALFGWYFGDAILGMLMVPDSIKPLTKELWQVGMLALPAQYVYAATGVMFRATRQVIPPLWVAAIVCVVNLLACLGFGLGWFGLPNWGYMGLAWATVGSQCLGAICNCALLMNSGYLQRRTLPTLRWLKAGLPYLFKVALPAGAAQIVWQSGYLTLFVLVASLPFDSVNALAGLTAGLRVEALLFLPGMAFNMSVAVLVGNSLGAGKPKEAKKVALTMVAFSALAMSLVAALLWPFRQDIALLLSQEPGTQAQIVNYLTYNLLSTPFSIASTVMGGVMTGAGATKYNLMIFGGTFWLVRLPLGWLLGHILWGTASGVFVAMLVSQCLQTSIMLYVVLRRDWMRFVMSRSRQPNHA
ncbi:MAG: MATE family efflux transporter [Desulfovibrio sp. MES5]|nr:MAG: MATE family efflux transporter [Desulfovibrio sp. MES5]